MKNIILSISIILGLNTLALSQEIQEKITFDEVEIGTVDSGNLVKISTEEEISEVIISEKTIEIKNNTDTVVLNSVKHIGIEKVNNLDISRYKCKNSSGENIIFSVTKGVASIFNIETSFVITLTNKNILG